MANCDLLLPYIKNKSSPKRDPLGKAWDTDAGCEKLFHQK